MIGCSVWRRSCAVAISWWGRYSCVLVGSQCSMCWFSSHMGNPHTVAGVHITLPPHPGFFCFSPQCADDSLQDHLFCRRPRLCLPILLVLLQLIVWMIFVSAVCCLFTLCIADVCYLLLQSCAAASYPGDSLHLCVCMKPVPSAPTMHYIQQVRWHVITVQVWLAQI